jgi:ADP-ribosylglycohydrolase
MSNKTLANQITSLLLGIAAGDALGVPVEFRPRGSFRVRDMRGYGTHNQPPGTWSDDTSLALCLAGSLSRGFDLSDIARNFVRWRDEGASPPAAMCLTSAYQPRKLLTASSQESRRRMRDVPE